MDARQIGRRLRELRGERTLSEVAEAVQVTPSALGNYELGLRVPRDEVKVRLANYYMITIDELFYAS